MAVDELNNNFVHGRDEYPKDIPSAIQLLTRRRGNGGYQSYQTDDQSVTPSTVSFAQQSTQSHHEQDKKCYKCNQYGHIARKCPNKGKPPKAPNIHDDDKSDTSVTKVTLSQFAIRERRDSDDEEGTEQPLIGWYE